MMERFNFYDVYGYLIPGVVGLLAVALPFFLVLPFDAFSITELTGVLIVGYVAGHAISGIARNILPTERHRVIGEEDPVPLSVWWLSAEFAGQNPPTEAFKKTLTDLCKKQFGFDPDAKAKFFMCRTALIQQELAAYVEQYQGMESLTRSMAAVARLAPIYYAAWVITSSLTHMLGSPELRHAWPLFTLGACVVAVDFVVRAVNKDIEAEGGELLDFDFHRVEPRVVIASLMVVGATGGVWYPLPSRDTYQLIIVAALLSMLALRFKSAFLAFERSLVRGVFYDFVALVSAPKPDEKPGHRAAEKKND